MHKGWSALLVLAINVTMIMLAGSTTLAIQARLAQR
jgi:hypothetical protein